MDGVCSTINVGSVADCITAIIALCAFVLSIVEYCKHKKKERVAILSKYNERYATDENIRSVVCYLEAVEENKEDTLGLPNIHQLEMFMRFFEELYCLIKASAVNRNIVYYMFGHYVLIFNENKEKWPKELGYNAGYWKLFSEFVNMMEEAKTELFPNVDNCSVNVKRIKL